MSDTLNTLPSPPTRRKREPSISDPSADDSKKLKISDESSSLVTKSGGLLDSQHTICTRCPTSPLEPISEGTAATSGVQETFDEICVHAGNTLLAYQNNITNMIYDTLFIQDLPLSSHLYTTLDALNPLPPVILRVHCFSNSDLSSVIPTVSVRCSPELELECTASMSSPHLPVIPCSIERQNPHDDNKTSHSFKVTTSASTSDIYGSVLLVTVRLKPNDLSKPRTAAALLFDFHYTEGQTAVSLYKMANGSTGASSSVGPPARYFRGRFRSGSGRQLMRQKPNLSLSIPPPSAVSLTSALKSAIYSTATTPSAMAMMTPVDQRIQTPLAPPPITTEINPLSLQRYAGTPTDPLTPSLAGRHTPGMCLNRLTKRAMAAGTPVHMRESSAFPLASPLVAHNPGASLPYPMRRSNSFCTPDSGPSTPGGYFRPIVAPSVIKRSTSLIIGEVKQSLGTPGGYFKTLV